MTHSPALKAILESHPAVWFAYMNLPRFKAKIDEALDKGDAEGFAYYSQLHKETCWLIETLGFSVENVGKRKEAK